MSNRTGRPKGSRNTKPSKAAIANYFRLLSEKADQGDVNAAGWLVSIAEQNKGPRDERC